MKKHIHFIYGVCIIGLLVGLIISYHNNNVLESRINTTNKYIHTDLKIDELNSEKSFKEDYYISQQSKDTNLLLVVFSTILGFTAFFTFTSFIRRVEDFKSEMKAEAEKKEREGNENQAVHIQKLEKLENNLLDIKNDLYYELITIKQNESKESLSLKDLNSYIFYGLISARYSMLCTLYYREKGLNLSDGILGLMNSRLNNLKIDLESVLGFDKVEKCILPIKEKESIINLIKEINQVRDTKTFEILSSIFNLLEFKD